jgi:hypothetical protein
VIVPGVGDRGASVADRPTALPATTVRAHRVGEAPAGALDKRHGPRQAIQFQRIFGSFLGATRKGLARRGDFPARCSKPAKPQASSLKA